LSHSPTPATNQVAGKLGGDGDHSAISDVGGELHSVRLEEVFDFAETFEGNLSQTDGVI
jgi:hypothetical protein